MTFIVYISKLKLKYPKLFAAEKIEITINNLEKLLNQTYEEGYKEGYTSKSIFENIFGTK